MTMLVLLTCALATLGSGLAFAQQFQGRVYNGAVGVETTPLSGVTVTLYGSNNSGSLGSVITSATTDAAGWYGLSAIRTTFEYYNIVETDPSGYSSTGAKTVSGTVVSSNQIQYTYPLSGKTLTGNKFYDQKPQASNNPPVAEAGGPYSCNTGGSITFDGSGSYDPDSGDSIAKYEWDLDNDGQYDDATGKTVSKTYNSAGSGTVGLRVTDTHGAQDTDTATYTVSDQQQSGGAVYGMKFNDLNGNHVKDSGETGISGWTITLSGSSGTTTAATGSDGKYSFTNVTAGTYTVSETAQTGWTQTYPTSSGTHTVSVASGQAVSDVDFGNIQSSPTQPHGEVDFGDAPSPYPAAGDSLGGPWLGGSTDAPDAESGMQRDAHALGDNNANADDENGIKFWNGWIPKVGMGVFEYSVSVPQAYNYSIALVVWVDFNRDGDWDDPDEMVLYNKWNPGSMPSGGYGYSFTVPGNTTAGMTFARARICDARSAPPLPSGTYGPGEVEDVELEIKDIGTPPPGGSLRGIKFNDLNGNGIWDAGEPVLANWTIWLDVNGNLTQDPGEPTTLTDAGGLFAFTGLADGNYSVLEVNQPNWVQTTPAPLGPIVPGKKYYYPLNYVIKNGQPEQPFSMPIFGNHQVSSPGGGTGAVKWFQPPLYNPDKFDEKCFYGWGEPSMDGAVTMADDWFCYNPRPVTSVTWWGAYAGWDSVAPPPIAPQRFHIGIWTNTPKGKDKEWGRPGKMVREWFVDKSQLNEKAERSHRMPEWKDNQPDTCFRYTFSIPQPEWFRQEGDSTEYWLSVAAVYQEPPKEHIWGWLTRELYFNANAARIFAPASARPDSLFRIGEPLPPYWDMAFVLGTDENTAVLDFGDAPDGYGTSFSHNAALHLIRRDVRLGQTVDAEDDGRPDSAALGDDKNGSADEDGVSLLTGLVPGKMAKAAVSVSIRGFLSAWLDINGNGKWEMRDCVIRNMELKAGNAALEFPVADDAVPGKSFMRFRFSTLPDVWVKGFAPDGEVEDYQVDIQKSETGVHGNTTGTRLDEFKLYPNYPNPFNPSTTIQFDLPNAAYVRLSIYNLLGQEITVLVDEGLTQGSHQVRWNGLNARHMPAPAGVYLYRLDAAPHCGTGKLLLLK
jgi:hypothetical protein